ncbi:GrpB family protein [Bremerella cremea]|uniref:GrpB family protein n=1 Tax=Bremerella cremea TaxID=1031537 RepID=A0A368KLZ1_9BACT|nr:GrpB family protein [Bremerella cremea]RCS42228.1 GrpB family protein [Bremerella cremea]
MTSHRIIEVVPSDPNWWFAYQIESSRLAEVLGDVLVLAHHIGSTAVPALAAKPVIDILLEVTDLAALDAKEIAMQQLGYTPRGELGIAGRRFYLRGLVQRTHHVHAFVQGSPDVLRHLAFRDYLVAHPSVALQYAQLKQQCAAACDNDNDKYCEGKQAFVVEHERKAVAWYVGNQSDAV